MLDFEVIKTFTIIHIKIVCFDNFQSDKIKYYTMSVLRPDNSHTDIEDIVFLYRYIYVDLISPYFLSCKTLHP